MKKILLFCMVVLFVFVTAVSEASLFASTYLGGSNTEGFPPLSVALDIEGNIFIAGYTKSVNFPFTPEAYDTTHTGTYNNDDVFISKFNADLTELLASTFIGGSGQDICTDIVISSTGDVYITGRTTSNDFPTTQAAYDTSYNSGYSGEDVFVCRLDGDLSELQASTYLGGSAVDQGNSIVLDGDGNVLIGGCTLSSNFPFTPGAYDTSYNGGYQYGGDVFVARLDPDLSTLMQSTFLGGSGNEGMDGFSNIAIDNEGEIYIVGGTFSSNFPTTPGAFDEDFNYGDIDGFIAKFNTDLTGLLASTYLGGSDVDMVTDLALDHEGNIFVSSHIGSVNFPVTPEAYDTTYNTGYDGAVSKLNGDLSILLASSFFGGNQNEAATSLVLDLNANVYLTGFTVSENFPVTQNAYDDSINGEYDVFAARFKADLTDLDASTFLGGNGMEYYGDLIRNDGGNIVVAGATASLDFPTTLGAYNQEYNGGEYDVFVSKLDSLLSASPSGIGSQTSKSTERGFLYKAYPNPFNPVTTLSIALPTAGKVSLIIYDLQGREVAQFGDSVIQAGYSEYAWNAAQLCSGIYFAKVIAGEYQQTIKLLLVR